MWSRTEVGRDCLILQLRARLIISHLNSKQYQRYLNVSFWHFCCNFKYTCFFFSTLLEVIFVYLNYLFTWVILVWLKNKLIISIWYYNINITYSQRCKKWVSFWKRLSFHLHRKSHHFHVKTFFPNPFLTAFTIISILL